MYTPHLFIKCKISQDSLFFLHGMTHSVTREIILLLLFFSSHLHDKVKILGIFQCSDIFYCLQFVCTESWCQNVESTLFVSSKADFCETLPLTFNRFYQSFDKVAIQIFWHHLLIKLRPGLILGSHWSWTCITLCLILPG